MNDDIGFGAQRLVQDKYQAESDAVARETTKKDKPKSPQKRTA